MRPTLRSFLPVGRRQAVCGLLALAMPAIASADFATTVSGSAGNGSGFFGTAVQDTLAAGGVGSIFASDSAASGSAVVEPFSGISLGTSSSSASASLATGELKAFASTRGVQTLASGYAVNAASATASMRDVVRVTGDIAAGSFLAFTISYHGALSVDRTVSQLGDISTSTNGAFTFSAFAINGAGSTRSVQQLLVDGSCAAFSGRGCVSGSTVDDEFRVAIPISNTARNVFFEFSLQATSLGNAAADFGHTAGLSLDLPTGLDFTSDSGVLLSAPAAVPLPMSLPLLMLGLAGLGARVTRRHD